MSLIPKGQDALVTALDVGCALLFVCVGVALVAAWVVVLW